MENCFGVDFDCVFFIDKGDLVVVEVCVVEDDVVFV